MSHSELDFRAETITSRITNAVPGGRHVHLDDLHSLVSEYARRGNGIPPRLRRLQEELTDEAIEARFDNLPV